MRDGNCQEKYLNHSILLFITGSARRGRLTKAGSLPLGYALHCHVATKGILEALLQADYRPLSTGLGLCPRVRDSVIAFALTGP